jgi:Domain of unknown function (DUF4214)
MKPLLSATLTYRKYVVLLLLIPLVGFAASTRITSAAKYDLSVAPQSNNENSGSNIFAGRWRGLFDSRFNSNRLFDGPLAAAALPPQMSKGFNPTSIALNTGTSTLTFTITNQNGGTSNTGIAFTDNLPAGLVVATPTIISNNGCGGIVTAGPGSTQVSFSGGTLLAATNCNITVNVAGTTAGQKNNNVQVTSNEGGGNFAAAGILIVAPPTISASFGTGSIPVGGSTSLGFTITNPNTDPIQNRVNTSTGVHPTVNNLTGVGFTDALPSGLVVSTPNGQMGTCGGGTITATQGSNMISLSGATLPAQGSCTFSANVTATSAGNKTNSTGPVTSNEGGNGAANTAAAVIVVAPPSIAKAFNPTTIPLNTTTTLTFTITNPPANTVALTGVGFGDTLPTGLTVANSTVATCGGTLTTTAPTGISLTGATINANSQCQFNVTVTGAAAGNYTNTTGAVTSTNGGTGNTATANLVVAAPPTITKAFGAATIPLNGTTTLTFNIANPNGTALTGIAFTDTLPAGLVVATPNNLSNTCGGTATATAGLGTVSLANGSLTSNANCTMSLNVTGATAGVKNNTVQVTSTEGGAGNTSNASITVVAPPAMTKTFGAASIPLNGSTSLQFVIQNNNATIPLTGVGFSDTLPAGLVVSTPNGQIGGCGGGTIVGVAGTNLISLTGASLPAGATCNFSVNTTGTTAGTKNNTTGNVTSNEGGAGAAASASINVVAPPAIAKTFGKAVIPLNGLTTLTFTLTNPAANAVALTGVGFNDTLPAGMVVATPNGLGNTCGGTPTAVAGSGTVSISGVTLAINGSCTVAVNVRGTAPGIDVNTVNATSTNGGTSGTATATLAVTNSPTASGATIAGTITDADGAPIAGTTVFLSGSQMRKTITDARGNYRFDDADVNSFYTVTPARANYDFSPALRSFSLIGDKTDAVFTGSATGDRVNPLDTAEYFVRQQYVDVLGREPDEGGFNYWSNQILACNDDAACIQSRRVGIAAAFFIEQEFQQTGSFVYDVYSGALGRGPVFIEFNADRQLVPAGPSLEAEKTSFARNFVQRIEFMQKYSNATTAESFVDALLQTVQGNSGVDLSSRRDDLVAQYNNGADLNESRGLVLREVATNPDFAQAQYNKAFVLGEYFSYLRRDPDQGGYDFWLNVVNGGSANNYRGMVCAFITSTEYQQRFSLMVTRSNADCSGVR